MKYEIQPAKHESIFPALRRLNPSVVNYNGELVVVFTDKSRGFVLISDNPAHNVGEQSGGWVSIEDSGTWLPCSITLTS